MNPGCILYLAGPLESPPGPCHIHIHMPEPTSIKLITAPVCNLGTQKLYSYFKPNIFFPVLPYLNRLYIYSDLKCSWIGRSVNGIFNRSEWRMTPFPHCTAWFFRNQFVYLSITPSTQPFVMIVGGCPTLYISGTIIIHFDWESCSSPTSYFFAD